MCDDRGIKRAALKVVNTAGRSVTSREVTEIVMETIPDALNKSIRFMLSVAANKDGTITVERVGTGRNGAHHYSSLALHAAKVL